MQITRTRSKYYLLSMLGASMVAGGVMPVAPSVQAQPAPEPPSIDKECSPNPVHVGEQITCIIDLEVSPGTIAVLHVRDRFPANVRVARATAVQFSPTGMPIPVPPCRVGGNTVTCPDPRSGGRVLLDEEFGPTFRVTIDAVAEQCGTFPNTATAEGEVAPTLIGPFFPFSNQDTEEITVEGCEEQAGGGDAAPIAAPITQEGEQESEAGEID